MTEFYLEQLRDNNPTFTRFVLCHNQIGDAGVHDLAEVLKSNHTLIELDLSHNQIGDAGARELAEALKGNRTLTELNLWQNPIGDAGAQALAEAGFEQDNGTYTRSVTVAPETPVTAGKYTVAETNRNDAREKQRRDALKNGEGI